MYSNIEELYCTRKLKDYVMDGWKNRKRDRQRQDK